MLTRAPDPLPATHRGHMLSHNSSNTTDSSQISYLCVCVCVLYVYSVCLCGRERRVCVCVKGMHSFWLVRAEPAASSQRVYSATFLSLSLLDSCIHTHPYTHTWKNTHGAYQGAPWLGLMTSGTTKGLSAFLFGRRSAASLINSHRKLLKAKNPPW